jgi:ABC-type transporter Mla subunit MlaD
MLARAQELASRAGSFDPSPNPVGGGMAIAEMTTILEQVAASGVDQVTNQLADWREPLDAIAERVEEVMGKIADLSDELRARSIEDLEEFSQTIDEQIEEMTSSVEVAFAETSDKINETIETTSKRLEELTGKAEATIEAALVDLQDGLGRARQDVDRIVSTLENTRQTVLTICRTLGIGASAAQPAVEVAATAFSAVA